MTGVEAVSNGVPAFRAPEARNAASTLVVMAILGITMFIGITLLAHAYQVIPGILIRIFGGNTQRLLPLYMIGVFVSFTLSQTGMVVRWRRLRTPG